jgi:hypothetical protein
MAKTPLEIKSLARAHTQTALKTLHGVMTSPDAPAAAKVAASQALLDRGWGKPSQSLEHSGAEGGALVIKWAD